MRRRVNILLIAVLAVGAVAALYPALGEKDKPIKKLNVAVYPFKAAGTSEATAKALTSIVSYQLTESDKIRIIEESNLQSVLDQQGLSQSGACDDSECQIEIGKLLNSQKFVRGELVKIGKLYIITMKVVDIQTGRTEFTTKGECMCKGEEELPQVVLAPVERIKCFLETGDKKKCSLEEDKLPPPPPYKPDVGAIHELPDPDNGLQPLALGKGSLYITTTPKGAQVFVDAELKGKSPVHVKSLEAGDHDIMITMKGHAPLTKTVTVAANKRTDIVERLSAQKGKLSIKSNPPGAMAYLDGKYIGKTPVELPGILIGKHKVKIEKKNYTVTEKTVLVEIGGLAKVEVSLNGLPGKILIASQPEGAKVFIDGKEVGTTTYSGKIASGKRRIRVSKKGYKSREEDIEIAPNRSKQLSWTLEKGPDVIEKDGMVYVPAGEFMMGCNSAVDNKCEDDEKPYHKVYLDAFYIDKYKVTVDSYKACVNAGRCKEPYKGSGKNAEHYNWGKSVRGNHPINGVNWNDAKSYCEYVGKRLPTEAEWEKAARGTDGRKYPWGNEKASCSYAIMDDRGKGCGKERTWPVGSKPGGASPYGAQDMVGNLHEMTADLYDEKYYSKSPSRNPKGASKGTLSVVRGGNWNEGPDRLRSSRRGRFPGFGHHTVGFRCARTP